MGIQRFDDLITSMRRNRNITHNKEIEIELKGNYVKLCGIYRRRNIDGELH